MKYIWIILTVMSAFALGKRVFFWAIAAYFFSWAALIACIAIPANQKRLEERQRKVEDWSNEMVEQAVVNKEVQKIETVEDLFKQLDKPKG
jgi:hypothetical protein